MDNEDVDTRRLLMLRHAKSRWDEPGVEDHDRGLAPRGIEAARRIGRLIAERGLVPDRVLCSSATRTRETLALVEKEWPAPVPVKLMRTLYLAAPSTIVEIIQRQPPEVRTLLVLGHNPGMEHTISKLCHPDEEGHLARAEEKFPTAALALIEFSLAGWDGVRMKTGRLRALWLPRELAKA